MNALRPEELLQQLQVLNSNAGGIAKLPPEVRSALSMAARETSYKLETPTETLARLLLCQPIEGLCIRIATDLKLFTILAGSSEPKSVEELAQSTGADEVLLARLLRALVSIHAIEQSQSDRFSVSPAYATLANSSLADAWGPCYDFLGGIYRSFPHHLAEKAYRNPTDPNDTSVQKAYDAPNTPFMDILFQRPRELQGFATLMSVWADGFNQVGTLYPVQQNLVRGFDQTISDVMFVDVGGSLGQKSIALKKAFPDLPGRVVVQDIMAHNQDPGRGDSESDRHGIEMTIHDFTTEQPIRGARCYYIRQCLHNWTDEKSAHILRHLGAAMRPGYSKLLIHEIIVPERGAGTWVTAQDMEMMGMFATSERTRAQWEHLCAEAGMKVKAVYLDGHPSCEGIIEVEID